MNNSNNKSSRRYGTRSTKRERSRSRHNKNNNANAFARGKHTNSTKKNTNSISRSLGKYIPSAEKKISTVYFKDNRLFIKKPEGVERSIRVVKGKIKSGDNVWLVKLTSHSEPKSKYGSIRVSAPPSTFEVKDKLSDDIIKGIETRNGYKNIREIDDGKKYTWKTDWHAYEAEQFILEDAE